MYKWHFAMLPLHRLYFKFQSLRIHHPRPHPMQSFFVLFPLARPERKSKRIMLPSLSINHGIYRIYVYTVYNIYVYKRLYYTITIPQRTPMEFKFTLPTLNESLHYTEDRSYAVILCLLVSHQHWPHQRF